MVAREIAGVLLLGLAAVCTQALVIFSTVISDLKVPYYSCTGFSNLLMASGLVVFVLLSGKKTRFQTLTQDKAKWIFARGLMGAAAAVFSLAAVAAGAPIGDSSALGTVNIIVACLLGRFVLGEDLRILQIVSMVVTVVGGIFITKPEFMFGAPAGHATSTSIPWGGYALALASGISSGFLFIVSRKMQDVSTLVVTTSVTVQEGSAFLILALAGFFKEPPIGETLEQEPLRVVLCCTGLLLLIFGSAGAISAGSTMCPAAASSTVYMFTSMTLGYIAQSVIHHQVPDAITLTGAALMVLAVILMSVPPTKSGNREYLEEGGSASEEDCSDASRAEEGRAGSVQLQVPGHERIVACFCTEASGHLNPMLAVTSGLISEGWTVHFYCPKAAQQAVEGVGAVWRHMGEEDLDIYDLAASVIKKDLGEQLPQEVRSLPFTVVPATLGLLPYLLESVAALKPKFVVYDACAPWGSLVGEALRIPRVSVMTALPMAMAERAEHSKSFSELGQRILEATSEALQSAFGVHLDHNHSYTMYAPFTVITSSRAWHHGHLEFPHAQFHYWGPLVSERKGGAAGDEALAKLLDADRTIGQKGSGRRLVFCSLGTVTTGGSFAKYGFAVVDYYSKLLRAAATMPDVIFVLSVGKAADMKEEIVTEVSDYGTSFAGDLRITMLFGQPVPENVLVARSVDQPALMEWANVFVTHCGQNSCNEAVMNAVPVITTPFFGDQVTNAARFEELGCGIMQCFLKSLDGGHGGFDPDLSLITAGSLANSVRRVLEEPQFFMSMSSLRDRQQAECGKPLTHKIKAMLAAVERQA